MIKIYTTGIIYLIASMITGNEAKANETRSFVWENAKLSECARALEEGRVIRETIQYEHNLIYLSNGGKIYHFYFNVDTETFSCRKMTE
jgi:hypothetical protein|tara:strand:- start:111 stop:377 length:267 start_codon:yes stop_codon:yes gene_type:complete